jgi:hypothetical protein
MTIRTRPFPPQRGCRFERPPYPSGWFAVARSGEVALGALQYPAHLGGAAGTLFTESQGLGFNVARFTGVVRTLLVVCATPIEPELSIVHITPYLERMDDAALGEAIGALFLAGPGSSTRRTGRTAPKGPTGLTGPTRRGAEPWG